MQYMHSYAFYTTMHLRIPCDLATMHFYLHDRASMHLCASCIYVPMHFMHLCIYVFLESMQLCINALMQPCIYTIPCMTFYASHASMCSMHFHGSDALYALCIHAFSLLCIHATYSCNASRATMHFMHSHAPCAYMHHATMRPCITRIYALCVYTFKHACILHNDAFYASHAFTHLRIHTLSCTDACIAHLCISCMTRLPCTSVEVSPWATGSSLWLRRALHPYWSSGYGRHVNAAFILAPDRIYRCRCFP